MTTHTLFAKIYRHVQHISKTMLNVLSVVVVIIIGNSFQFSHGAYIFVKVLEDDNFSSESEIVVNKHLNENVQEKQLPSRRVGMRSLDINKGKNIINRENEMLLPEPNESAKSLNLFLQIFKLNFSMSAKQF